MHSTKDLLLVVEHCERMRKRIDAKMFNCTSKFARDRLQSKMSAYAEIEKYVQRLIATSRWDKYSSSNCGETQVDINNLFQSNYLSASDLQGHNVPVSISHVAPEQMENRNGQMETKAVVYFNGKEKGLVLNVTNKNTLCDLFGTETDNWINQQVMLLSEMTDFQGKRMPCIRVGRIPSPGQVGQPVGQPQMPQGPMQEQAPPPQVQQPGQAPWEGQQGQPPQQQQVTKQDMPQRPYSGPDEGEPGF